MELTAIVTTHQESPTSILCNLATQIKPPFEALIGASELPPSWSLPPLPFNIAVHHFKTRDDFGYSKRNFLAKQAKTEFIGFFCQDDSYDERYIDRMLRIAEAENADVVWCPWNDIPTCTFKSESSTLGNFIVRTRLFLELGGFPLDHRGHGWRDAAFIDLVRLHGRICWVPLMMYKHNVPYLPGTRTTRWGQVI